MSYPSNCPTTGQSPTSGLTMTPIRHVISLHERMLSMETRLGSLADRLLSPSPKVASNTGADEMPCGEVNILLEQFKLLSDCLDRMSDDLARLESL